MIDTQIVVAVITASSAVIVGAASYFLNNKYERQRRWSEKKLEYYQKLFNAMSDLAIDGVDKIRAQINFSEAINNIALVASQAVITTLMNFHDEIKFTNKNRSVEKHDLLLKKLILEIRKDLDLSKKDKEDSFVFHLVGTKPK